MEDEEARASKKPRGGADSGMTAFALRLAKHLAEAAGDDDGNIDARKNIVFSPVSIYSAGARGETLKELLAVLGASSRNELAELVCNVADGALADRSGPLVAFAWALWHEKTVVMRPEYCAVAAESYKSEIREADFIEKAEEARAEINNWVSKATKQLITSILPEDSVHDKTRLVIANVIYFKGAWKKAFSKRYTKDRLFYRLDGSMVRVPFMSNRQDQFMAQYRGFKVLKLPYYQRSKVRAESNESDKSEEFDDECQDSEELDSDDYDECECDSSESPQFSMVIFLPEKRDGLQSLVQTMSSTPRFLWDHLPKSRVEIDEFWLPKFKISFSSKINEVLEVMGIKTAFDSEYADLKDMLVDQEGDRVHLFLDNVIHKAVIEVNEEGTEAVASTLFIGRTLLCARRSIKFVADHPFVFFVLEEVSGSIVFMGHVLDPTKSE